MVPMAWGATSGPMLTEPAPNATAERNVPSRLPSLARYSGLVSPAPFASGTSVVYGRDSWKVSPGSSDARAPSVFLSAVIGSPVGRLSTTSTSETDAPWDRRSDPMSLPNRNSDRTGSPPGLVPKSTRFRTAATWDGSSSMVAAAASRISEPATPHEAIPPGATVVPVIESPLVE